MSITLGGAYRTSDLLQLHVRYVQKHIYTHTHAHTHTVHRTTTSWRLLHSFPKSFCPWWLTTHTWVTLLLWQTVRATIASGISIQRAGVALGALSGRPWLVLRGPIVLEDQKNLLYHEQLTVGLETWWLVWYQTGLAGLGWVQLKLDMIDSGYRTVLWSIVILG